MKQPITIRIDPELLANARACAKEENRTLTNFLETVLKERIGAKERTGASGASSISKRMVDRRKGGRGISKGLSNA